MSDRGENTDSNKLITVFNKNKHGFRYIIRFYLISWKDISSGCYDRPLTQLIIKQLNFMTSKNNIYTHSKKKEDLGHQGIRRYTW